MVERAPRFRRTTRATRPNAFRSDRSRTPAARDSPMDQMTTGTTCTRKHFWPATTRLREITCQPNPDMLDRLPLRVRCSTRTRTARISDPRWQPRSHHNAKLHANQLETSSSKPPSASENLEGPETAETQSVRENASRRGLRVHEVVAHAWAGRRSSTRGSSTRSRSPGRRFRSRDVNLLVIRVQPGARGTTTYASTETMRGSASSARHPPLHELSRRNFIRSRV